LKKKIIHFVRSYQVNITGLLIKKSIPNIFTLLNLLTGCLGIIYITIDLIISSQLIWLAVTFDYFDGFTARILNAKSEIGKQLDSLADMVSFGVLPSLIMFELISDQNYYLAFLALLIAAFSALRLAKFNIDKRQTNIFIGMPTPANALVVSSFPSIIYIYGWQPGAVILAATVVIMSVLLIVPLKLMALKFEDYSWNRNSMRYLLIGISIVSLLFFKTLAIPAIYLLYLALSLIKEFR